MDTHTPAQRRLPSLGSHFGPPLCDHGGPATHQQNRYLAIQRNLPFLARPSSFSRPVHVAPLPEADASQGHSSTGGPPRPLANQVVSLAEAAHDFNLRSRFGGAHRLRQTAVCSRGVQPSQTGATFLPPADLLRGASAGVLAWVAAARQYREQHGSGSLLEALPGQGPAAPGSLSPPLPSRLRVFWQAGGGVPGWPGLRLCDRGQAVLHPQSARSGVSLSQARSGMGGRRVSLPTPALATPASLHRRAPSDPSRPGGSSTTDPLQGSQVCLPCSGHQCENPSLEGLEVLCPTRHHREKHPRTALRLPFGQDSYRGLGGQCRLLSDSALRLQPGALVQEALLAQGVSLRHAGYHSYGLPGLAGQTHQPRGPERLGAAPRLSLSGTVPSRTEEDRKTPASMNSLNLQVTPPRPFSIFNGSASKNRKFTHYWGLIELCRRCNCSTGLARGLEVKIPASRVLEVPRTDLRYRSGLNRRVPAYLRTCAASFVR